jgi:hypothetical protein
MSRRLATLCAFAASGAASAHGNPMVATFQDEGARIALTTIAGEAGLRIANPEAIRGTLRARFDDAQPASLFPKLAWQMGYELRIRGDEVWLHRMETEGSAERHA